MTTRFKENPDFAAKTKAFLTMASAGNVQLPRHESTSPNLQSLKEEAEIEEVTGTSQKQTVKKTNTPVKMTKSDPKKDTFCWVCHRDKVVANCQICPRGYHIQCVPQREISDNWVCPECQTIRTAEDTDSCSPALKLLTIPEFCGLLKYIMQRIKNVAMQPFLHPVSRQEFPDYYQYIVQPMDLSVLDKKVKDKSYKSTESFLADAKWLVHNSVIFNGSYHPLTVNAKSVVKQVKKETREIEICPDCYSHSYSLKDDWFVEPCRISHTLIYAKLKGYPFWPAKAVRVLNDFIDARFFGDHDRAWIPVQKCYLLSKNPPLPIKKKHSGYEHSMEELKSHLSRLQKKSIPFRYAPVNTVVDPKKVVSLLKPSDKDETINKKKTQLVKQEEKSEIKQEYSHSVKTEGSLLSPVESASESDTVRKRGRPRKYTQQIKSPSLPSPSNIAPDTDSPKKRGRPKKCSQQTKSSLTSTPTLKTPEVNSPKKRGCPGKYAQEVEEHLASKRLKQESEVENETIKSHEGRNKTSLSVQNSQKSSVSEISKSSSVKTGNRKERDDSDDELVGGDLVIDEDGVNECSNDESEKVEGKFSSRSSKLLEHNKNRPESNKLRKISNDAKNKDVKINVVNNNTPITVQKQRRNVRKTCLNKSKVVAQNNREPDDYAYSKKIQGKKSQQKLPSNAKGTDDLSNDTNSKEATSSVDRNSEMFGMKDSNIPPSELRMLVEKAGQVDNLTNRINSLEREVQRLRSLHEQEIAEMKHNHKLTLLELQNSWEQEQKSSAEKLKKLYEAEKNKEVDAAKKKQWCTNCGKEAHFYCCWNTSYCTYSCQQAHWPVHVDTCTQAHQGYVTSVPVTST
ncbi:protein kinase C-binding protein 1-like [Limulus polyphemus]|uniref:Protein kinase C-binding protein 1-like n=1 Tax=Limulus polyphemus TaxID=6850 RepID=A0ABM1SP96_LIMPO|nr:protein kinase C-binding protein 1-like [Limulus polyphemus]